MTNVYPSRPGRPDPTFPLLYHAHHSRHMEDLPFWAGLAREQGSPILELGCGTGRVLIPLAQSGRLVYGLDLDPAMLTMLRRQLPPELSPSVRLIQADLSAFCLAQLFPLIILPCNTLSTLPPGVRRATFACAARHLRPGGVFAASLPNPSLLQRLPAETEPEVEEVFPHPVDGEPVQVSSAWQRTARRITFSWHYDHLLPDGSVERVSAQAGHSLEPAAAYEEDLSAAGFTQIHRLGNYNRSAYSQRSPYLILIASR